jgi:hypothetical protein
MRKSDARFDADNENSHEYNDYAYDPLSDRSQSQRSRNLNEDTDKEDPNHDTNELELS